MAGIGWGDTELAPSIKRRVGTPLVGTGLVDDEVAARLRAVSVTTVEEFLGLIAANPRAVIGFLPGIDLPQVQADGAIQARSSILAKFDEFRGVKFALGARFPADLDVKRLASAEYAETWIAETLSSPAAKPEMAREVVLDCFGPIRDQGDRGTCVAHAVCAVAECQEKRVTGESIDLSEQFVYWTAKSNDGDPDGEGTWLHVSMPVTERDGACLEAVWPYNPTPAPGNESQGPPSAGATTDAERHLLREPREIAPRDSSQIRTSLDQGRPVAIALPVFDNWESNPNTDTTGLIPMPLPDSVLAGGHAMCATGYAWDPDFAGGGYLLIRNSWGTRWAPDSPAAPGYGALPFLYVDRYGAEAWTTDV